MSDWVHCNNCFTLPSSSSQKFFLSSCGHIFCNKCVSSGAKNKCSVCNQECSVIEINRQMKSDIQQYFLDPVDVAKKQQKQLFQILNFQKTQRDRLLMHFKGQNKKFQQFGDFFQKEMKKKQEMNKELASLREENRQLNQNLQSQTFSKLPAAPSNLYRGPFTPNTMGTFSTKRISPFLHKLDNTNLSMMAPPLANSVQPTNRGSDNSGSNPNIFMSIGMTTPRMLGLDKNENQRETVAANPYNGAWPANKGRTPTKANLSTGTTPVSNLRATPANNNSFVSQIKLPFRLNANSLPR